VPDFIPHFRAGSIIQTAHFRDNALIGKNQDRAGQPDDFRHLGGDYDDRLPFDAREVPDQLVDLLFGADVDSHGRFVNR